MLATLKLWAIVLSLALVALAVGIQYFVFDPLFGRTLSAVATALLLLAGVSGFSWQVWRLLERVDVRLAAAYAGERTQRRQLEALGAATADLVTGIDMDEIAQKIVERSRDVTGARFGALAVLGDDGAIARFHSSGIDATTRARLGPPPSGHGLLGLVIREGRTLRLDDLTRHPASAGFPPHHPHMKCLLAVPVRIQGAVIGSLYVADREDGRPFTEADEQALERFAVQAAAAIQNARLHEQLARLSVVAERERIAMDLHDGVIQALFGVRLQLESALAQLPAETEPHDRLDGAVDQISAVMADIRHYIFDLRSETDRGSDMPQLLRQLLDSLRVDPLFTVELRVDGPERRIQRPVLWELWHIAREALTNAVRHSRGDRLTVSLRYAPETLFLEIGDNGAGWDGRPAGDGHHGLENMASRARSLGAELHVERAPGGGTLVRVAVPAARAFADAVEERRGWTP